MASIKDLKKRITTVKNTQQTTRAMKMVSAAKLRRAQEAIQSQRPYAKHIANLLYQLSLDPDSIGNQPLLFGKASKNFNDVRNKKSVLLVVVTSDRGLCAGFNSNVIKTCQKWINTNQGTFTIHLAFIGRKGYEFFKNRKVEIAHYFQETGGKVTFPKAKQLVEALITQYLDEKTETPIDEVKFIYNEFKNAATQQVVIENFLPLTASRVDLDSSCPVETESNYIVKPSRPEVLKLLLEKNFSVQAFRILLESQAGEHGARMSAMENATKNAGEMMRKLALQYNKQRQAGITTELLEIISGSESQKG